GQVHAVAEAADAQGRLAGHRAADENLVDAEQFDLAGLLPGDHLVFLDDHFAGDGRDVVAAYAAAVRLAVGAFNFLALVGDPLGHALSRAAIVPGADDVLGPVG